MKENKQNTPRVVRWWWVRWNKIIQEEAYGGLSWELQDWTGSQGRHLWNDSWIAAWRRWGVSLLDLCWPMHPGLWNSKWRILNVGVGLPCFRKGQNFWSIVSKGWRRSSQTREQERSARWLEGMSRHTFESLCHRIPLSNVWSMKGKGGGRETG